MVLNQSVKQRKKNIMFKNVYYFNMTLAKTQDKLLNISPRYIGMQYRKHNRFAQHIH